jgi:putative molybdopterin biosynthesis protein
MDGIAIRAAAAPLAGSSELAGRWRLGRSSFVWVDTGEPMPPDTDTVVERERVEHSPDGSAWVTGPAPRGLHVRTQGEDFPAGQSLIPAGQRLRPVDLAAAAAGGHAHLEVIRRPVVAIIPTGDEIRPAGSPLHAGDITDSNSIMLAAQAVAAGGRPLACDVQPDDPHAIAAQIRKVAGQADIVLVIAGSSAGRRDHTAAVLSKVGGVAVHGVAVRPGHPVLLGHAQAGDTGSTGSTGNTGSTGHAGSTASGAAVPVIGVPGYPLAAAVIFELFAVPLLSALQGIPQPDRERRPAQLACDWTSAADVEEWVPVALGPSADRHAPDGTEISIATPSGRGAGAISRLLHADAWWQIPIGQAKFVRGEVIDVLPIPGARPGLAPDTPGRRQP